MCFISLTGLSAEKAGLVAYSNLRYANWEIWDYYDFCWAREQVILHKADFAIRELFYYDKYINSHAFDFDKWQRKDLYQQFVFTQKKSNKKNEAEEFFGYPLIYKCSPNTWANERSKCLYKHLVNWKIPLDKVISI